MKIIRNDSGASIELVKAGIVIPAGESFTIFETDYSLFASTPAIDEISPYVNSGDIVVTDGSNDLTPAVGIIHLQTGLRKVQASLTDTEPGVLEDKIESNSDVLLEVTGTTNKKIKLSTDLKFSKNFYVSKNGNDTTGDGSISRPFLTIKAAITYINANEVLSAGNNVVIEVSAGNYTEDTLVLPAFCSLWGKHYRTRIQASSENINLIESAGSHTIKGFVLSGVTNTSNYLVKILTATGKRVTLQDISFSTYEAIGSISNAVYIESTTGTTTVRMKQVDFGDVVGKVIHLGANSKVVVRGAQIFSCPDATFLHAESNSAYSVYNVDVDEINIGVYHNNTGASDASNVNLLNAPVPIVKLNNSELFIKAITIISTNALIATTEGLSGYWLDGAVGDNSFRVAEELIVGTTRQGRESVFGEGDSYFLGMNIYNSDGTDTSTSEGTLTSIYDDAIAIDGTTFSFQDKTAGHCIYLSSEIHDGTDYVRYYGIKVAQKLKAIEVTPQSFEFEYWDGSAWVADGVMATHSSKFYSYSREVFIRADISEHIRFGRGIGGNNAKKTIEGKERYWSRIRIKYDLTQAPTFDQFKLSSSRTEINADGTVTMHGKSRFREAISFQSNTFGETGGVTHSSIDVGSGSTPYSWRHVMKNNRLNGENDALYAMTVIPDGACTACGMSVKVKYIVLQTGASTDGELVVSFHPVEVGEVPAADETGGHIPVPRPHTETELVTARPAQVKTLSAHLDTAGSVHTADAGFYDVSDFYEGDVIFIRMEYTDNGPAKKDIAVIGFEIEGIKWRLGSRP